MSEDIDHDRVIRLVQRYMAMDDRVLSLLREKTRPVRYRRNDFISQPPQVTDRVFILTDGLVRGYCLAGDREINLRLMCDGAAVLSLSSYLTGKPTYEYLQCLGDCQGVWLKLPPRGSAAAAESLFERITRVLAEQHYLALERRMLMLQQRGAAARYAYFCAHMEPRIVQETPAYHIASYLGITAEAFSRIRHSADA